MICSVELKALVTIQKQGKMETKAVTLRMT
jgi:hypothetical protein